MLIYIFVFSTVLNPTVGMSSNSQAQKFNYQHDAFSSKLDCIVLQKKSIQDQHQKKSPIFKLVYVLQNPDLKKLANHRAKLIVIDYSRDGRPLTKSRQKNFFYLI